MKSRPRRALIAVIFAGAAAAGALLCAVGALALYGPLPDVSARTTADATRFLDRNGHTLYAPADDGLRRAVPLDQVSPSLRAAILATEDAAFYQHPGVNPVAIVRAAAANLRARSTVSGAGTITQQVVRNVYLAPAPAGSTGHAWGRKAHEALLALRLSRRMDKDGVLALYLNHAYFGNLAYGVEAAAHAYFGRPAAGLDLAESALLAGLIQSPAAYDPRRHPEAALARRAQVLGLMVRTGDITPATAEAARTETLHLTATPFPIEAPHFVAWVQDQVDVALGPGAAARGGLRVVTTLDLGLQHLAEDTVTRKLAGLKEHDVSSAAVVALDPATGDVLAMVGSAGYFDDGIGGAINLALTPRQPGSAMKPLLYGLALERDITAATPLADVRTAFTTRSGELYAPNNYDGRFHGLIPAREALAGSYNVPAVRLLQQEGIPRFLATAAAAGITTLADRDGVDLSVILGGAETPLLELTDAFAGLAAGGERRPVRAILRIEDARGRILWQPPALPPVRMLSPESAWLVTDILADNEARTPAFGGNSPLLVNRPAAVKTGTTSDFRDNWTVGYTPDLVVGVWTGNPDNHPMKDISGVTGAAPIWHDLIEDALAGRPPRTFSRPPGLVRAEVCLPSGQRPTAACARRRMEWFKAGTEPREDDSYYRALLVCAATGLPAPAGGDCGTSPAVTRVFEFPPDEVLPWARSAGVALAPLPGYRDDIAIVPGAPASPGGGSGCPVRIVQPAPGLTLRLSRALPANVQVLSIEVSVAGAPPERLRVEVDGVPFAGLETPPYRVDWPLTVGAHRFRVVALRGTVEAETDEVGITVLPP